MANDTAILTVARRTGAASCLAGTVLAFSGVMGFGLSASPVLAGGNPDFEGILAASAPTGYTSSEVGWYNVGSGPATVQFSFDVRNLTSQVQSVNLDFTVHHILTFNGQDISDGAPGQPGIDFTHQASQTTQSLYETLSPVDLVVQPKGAPPLTKSESFGIGTKACGYYQFDIGQQHVGDTGGHATLVSGFVRALGCETTSPTPTPTTSPSPSGTVLPTSTVGPTPTPTVTPSGGVQGITVPETGANPPGTNLPFVLGWALLLFGGVLLASTRLLRRRDDH